MLYKLNILIRSNFLFHYKFIWKVKLLKRYLEDNFYRYVQSCWKIVTDETKEKRFLQDKYCVVIQDSKMHYILKQIVSDNEVPIEIHIDKDEVNIGRRDIITLSKFNQLSRHHAKFYRTENGSLFLKDMDSLNGCFVNDINIGSALKSLTLGDVIGFGVTRDQFKEGFVCVLCTNELSDKVKLEVIELSDDDEEEEEIAAKSTRNSANECITNLPDNIPTASSSVAVKQSASSKFGKFESEQSKQYLGVTKCSDLTSREPVCRGNSNQTKCHLNEKVASSSADLNPHEHQRNDQSDNATNISVNKKIKNSNLGRKNSTNILVLDENVAQHVASHETTASGSKCKKLKSNVSDISIVTSKNGRSNSSSVTSPHDINSEDEQVPKNIYFPKNNKQNDVEGIKSKKRKSDTCSSETIHAYSNKKKKRTGVFQDDVFNSPNAIISDDMPYDSKTSTSTKINDIVNITVNSSHHKNERKNREEENLLVSSKTKQKTYAPSEREPNVIDDNPHQISGSNLNDEIPTNHEFPSNTDFNYSQDDSIIIISDDESYFDFESAQTYVHIKKEPEEIDEDVENCEQIDDDLDFDDLNDMKLVNGNHQMEIDNRVGTIESKQAFTNINESATIKESEYDSFKKSDANVNDFFPVLSQAFETDDDMNENISHFVGEDNHFHTIKNSSDVNLCNKTHKNKEIEPKTDENSGKKKPRKTVLIDPKPIPHKEKRKRLYEGKNIPSTAQENISKNDKSQNSVLNKCTSRVDSNQKSVYKTVSDSSVNSSVGVSTTQPSNSLLGACKAGTSAKKSSVKTRSDKFSSRMGFLVNEVETNSSRKKKKCDNEKNTKVKTKQIASLNVAEQKDTANNKKCSVRQNMLESSYKSVNQNKVPPEPSNKSVNQNLRPNKSPTKVPASSSSFNGMLHQNPGIKSVVQSTSFSPTEPISNVTVSLLKSNPAILPNICTTRTSVINPRDPRLNRTAVSLPNNPDLNRLAIHTERSVTQNSVTTRVPVPYNRPNNIIVPKHFHLIKKIIELNIVWLQEQANQKSPPPVVSKGAANLPLTFKSYDSFVSSLYPMLMLEIWESLYTESKEIFASKKKCKKFYFSILSFTKREDYVELKCESIVNEDVSFSPREGHMAILDLMECSKKIRSRFAYIISHRIEPLNLTYIKASDWKKLYPDWLTNAKHWTFYAYVKMSEMNYRLNSLMKGNGICLIRNKLRLADSLNYIRNSPLLNDILQPRWSTFSVNYTASRATSEYSSCQMEVIKGVCDEIKKPKEEPKIILLQGPPGTGKTHTIAGIIDKLLNLSKFDMRSKILVAAPSNAAVDEIGSRIVELTQKYCNRCNIEIVRVGIADQVNAKMKPYFLDRKAKEAYDKEVDISNRQREQALLSLCSQIKNLNDNSPPQKCEKMKRRFEILQDEKCPKFQDFAFKIKALRQSHIILSTLSSCSLSVMLKAFQLNSAYEISCCIIDEATQCTELDILQPLALGINKLVLVGDHEQLPATVLSKLACKCGFEKSMLERFHTYFTKCYRKTPMYTLNEQFRMHSAICKFPSRYFYDRKVITSPKTDLMYENFPLQPYIFLNILTSQESSDSSSVLNSSEASIIVNICSKLRSVVHSASSIGIVTPYQAQRSLYKDALSNNAWYADIEVNTVDGFQGREKEIIILSSVRANSHSGSIGFLASRQRLNVAITRAQKCLIICAHADSLLQNPDWGALIMDAKERNLCVEVNSAEDITNIFPKHMLKR